MEELKELKDVRPDTLYILSAQNNNLGLWKVL